MIRDSFHFWRFSFYHLSRKSRYQNISFFLWTEKEKLILAGTVKTISLCVRHFLWKQLFLIEARELSWRKVIWCNKNWSHFFFFFFKLISLFWSKFTYINRFSVSIFIKEISNFYKALTIQILLQKPAAFVLKNFVKLREEHMCLILIFIKLQSERLQLIKKVSDTGIFLWVLEKFLEHLL